MNEVDLQRQYYARTAGYYDRLHLANEEHIVATEILASYVRHYGFESILDIGAGTGRLQRKFCDLFPHLQLIGVEPSAALRAKGYEAGLSSAALIDGDVHALPFPDKSFDLVTSFAVLHHVVNPDQAVAEMMRVASRAVFISDANLFGQGSLTVRMVKNLLRLTGLWRFAVLVKTKGKGYHISEEDGLFYPYSVFRHFRRLRKQCRRIHLSTFDTLEPNLVIGAENVCILALKKDV